MFVYIPLSLKILSIVRRRFCIRTQSPGVKQNDTSQSLSFETSFFSSSFPRWWMGSGDHWRSLYYDEKARYLSLLCIFMVVVLVKNKQEKEKEQESFWFSLQKDSRTNCSTHTYSTKKYAKCLCFMSKYTCNLYYLSDMMPHGREWEYSTVSVNDDREWCCWWWSVACLFSPDVHFDAVPSVVFHVHITVNHWVGNV